MKKLVFALSLGLLIGLASCGDSKKENAADSSAAKDSIDSIKNTNNVDPNVTQENEIVMITEEVETDTENSGTADKQTLKEKSDQKLKELKEKANEKKEEVKGELQEQGNKVVAGAAQKVDQGKKVVKDELKKVDTEVLQPAKQEVEKVTNTTRRNPN